QGGAIINAGNTFVVNAQDDTTLYVQSGSYCPRVPVTAITRPLPQVELGQGSDSISTVFPTTLQAPSGYVSYVWSNLANTSGITVNLPGLYCVTVIDNNGCAGSDCVFVTDSLVSDVRVPDKRSFSVYPNPANDRITIMLAEACKRCSISVCSTDGRTLKEDLFEGKEFILDITGMSSGVYFLNLKEENQSGQMRLIKH
ncbi:MAG: T9SS type A sorting domain-containing protein, partial [Bacteroidota bacterium]